MVRKRPSWFPSPNPPLPGTLELGIQSSPTPGCPVPPLAPSRHVSAHSSTLSRNSALCPCSAWSSSPSDPTQPVCVANPQTACTLLPSPRGRRSSASPRVGVHLLSILPPSFPLPDSCPPPHPCSPAQCQPLQPEDRHVLSSPTAPPEFRAPNSRPASPPLLLLHF